MSEKLLSAEYLHERAEHERLVAIGREIVLNAPQLFIDFDIEADGNPGRGSIASIGGVTPKGDRFYRELQPVSDLWVPSQRKFCEEHGLARERLIREGMDPRQAVSEFIGWVNLHAEMEQKTPVAQGFAIGWDNGFVNYYCELLDLPSPFGSLSFDLKSLAMSITGEWDWDLTRKDRLPKVLLPEGDFTHNALEDSDYQQELGFAMVGLIFERSRQLEELGLL